MYVCMYVDSVVIGDPVAVVQFKINLSPWSVALTTPTHYHHTTQSLGFHHAPKRMSQHKRRQTPLPCLWVGWTEVEVELVIPMYRKNALPGIPQELNIHASVHGLKAAMSAISDLDGCMETLSDQRLWGVVGGAWAGLHLLCKLPETNASYHSVNHYTSEESGANTANTTDTDTNASADTSTAAVDTADAAVSDAKAGGESPNNTSRARLDIARVYLTISSQDVADIFKSWVTAEEVLPTPPKDRWLLPHLHLTLSGLGVGVATNSRFVTQSLELEAVRGALMSGGGGGGGEQREEQKTFLPFLYGPFHSKQWSSPDQYSHSNRTPQRAEFTGKLLELLATTPCEKLKGVYVCVHVHTYVHACMHAYMCVAVE